MTDPAPVPDPATTRWRVRARLGVLLLVLLTTMGLCGAWWWPERTEWHYLIVTQFIPMCYVGLAWWFAHRRLDEGDDV